MTTRVVTKPVTRPVTTNSSTTGGANITPPPTDGIGFMTIESTFIVG